VLGFRIPKGDEMNVKILDIGRVLIIRLATRHPEKETPGKEAVFVRADGSLCPWQAGGKTVYVLHKKWRRRVLLRFGKSDQLCQDSRV